MRNILITTAVGLAVAALGTALAILRASHRRSTVIRRALEDAQRKLDQYGARLNILARALPNLQTLLAANASGESWQTLALDEGRALVWAEAAAFWRYTEKDHSLELQASRGLEVPDNEIRLDLEHGQSLVSEAAQKRIALLANDNSIVSEPRSLLAVPLLVGSDLWGVFRFVRSGDDALSSRDRDLMAMFVCQLSLALERREFVRNKEKFYLELVQTLADTLDSREALTQGQTREARRLARGIARELDLPDEFVYYLEFAALMHDIGKIAIDENLLKKPGQLTPQEYELVKKHPEIGYKILAPVTMLAPVAPMVLYHQEWFNGTGYPEGLSGEEIPLGARIVAILDAWAAMTSDRPWRPPLPREQALREIQKGAGTQFDPKVVEAFLATLERHGVSDAAREPAA